MKGLGKILGIVVAMFLVSGQLKAQEKVVKQSVKGKEMTISERVVKKPIRFEELPAPVQKSYKDRFGDNYRVKEVYSIREGGKQLYRVVTINESNSLLEIDFDATGKRIRETKKQVGREKDTRSTE